MFSRFIFSTISAFSIIISAAISDIDSTRSLEDDSLFSNAELPSMNPAPFSFDPSLIFLDPNAPLFSSIQTFEDPVSSTSNDIDTSDAFLGNIDSDIIRPLSETANSNNNELNFFHEDDSFQLADCSNSRSLTAFDVRNSRLRRRDGDGGDGGGGGEKCTNPATTPPTNSQTPPSSSSPDGINLDQLGEFLASPEMLNKATAIENQLQNTACFLLTDGRLPWGVCSSGEPAGQRRTLPYVEVAGSQMTTWALAGATLGR